MSNDIQTRRNHPPTLRARVQGMAGRMLTDMVGEARATEAAARTGLAFAAAHRAARNPADIERCSPESIASCVALSALTGLMPGGAMPSVWLVPRSGELQWMISHRGLMSLARRAGYQLSTAVVGMDDVVTVEFGEVTEHRAAPGREPTSLDELAGIIVSCKRLADGAILGRYWMDGAAVVKRSRARGAGPVWKSWPIEMAQKTAVKWACARGLVPIESIELDQALAADTRATTAPERVTVHVEKPQPKAITAAAAFSLDPEPEPEPPTEPQPDPDNGDPTDDGAAPAQYDGDGGWS